MIYVFILIGFAFLLYAISQFMKKSNSQKMNRILRYGFAAVFGLLALFFVIIAKVIPIGGLLGLLSFMSARGSLWRLFGSEGNSRPGERASLANTPMTREEALDILGLSGNPDALEIRDAHHKMMLKMHPDQGGSDYFASKLNQARDILL
ncbi:hypothetical protein MNBD_ALPHA01-1668 [hydrothermal vent metagenome]|uniref:J domain-containing protein n=1 Tax=hydrothermal vent metagenome TaxID=652676 RepID=A0A3B0TH04_9ZZZZ